jgi:hypothetical protein
MAAPKYGNATGTVSSTMFFRMAAATTMSAGAFDADALARISLIRCMPVVTFGYHIFGEEIGEY